LTLLVLWIGTNDHDSAATTNNTTFLAHFADGRSNFHDSNTKYGNILSYTNGGFL